MTSSEIQVFDPNESSFTNLTPDLPINPLEVNNQLYQEVRYFVANPFLFGLIIKLNRLAQLEAFKNNPFAASAVTIIETTFAHPPTTDQELEAYQQTIPNMLSKQGNWLEWARFIGTETSIQPFHFSLNQGSIQPVALNSPNRFVDIVQTSFNIAGISFSNAIFLKAGLTPELIQQSQLQLTKQQYLQLAKPL